MANSANLSASISANSGSAVIQGSVNVSTTPVASGLVKLTQVLTTSPAALGKGNLATLGAVIIKVLPGTGTQHVTLSLDNPQTQIISDIAEGLGVLLINPPATIYAAVNATTISVETTAVEQ